MKNKNTSWGLIILVMILLFGGLGLYYYMNEDKTNENKNNDCDSTIEDCNKTTDTKNDLEESKKLETNLKELHNSLSTLIVARTIDNYNAGGDYEIPKNTSLFEKTENKQLLVMEQILGINENVKNLVALDSTGKKITEEIHPYENSITVFYPYELFNKEYKKYFDEDINLASTKKSGLNTEYDKKFVYYENKRAGANGLGIEKINIKNVNKENNDLYKAELELTYTERAKVQFKGNETNALLTYQRKGNNIVLKSLIIK